MAQASGFSAGDFEGTVNKDHYLAGYPLFNAPGEVMDAIKDAGYQVLDWLTITSWISDRGRVSTQKLSKRQG